LAVRPPCSTGTCEREARKVITFLDGRKLPYCGQCAIKIGGKQAVIEP